MKFSEVHACLRKEGYLDERNLVMYAQKPKKVDVSGLFGALGGAASAFSKMVLITINGDKMHLLNAKWNYDHTDCFMTFDLCELMNIQVVEKIWKKHISFEARSKKYVFEPDVHDCTALFQFMKKREGSSG